MTYLYVVNRQRINLLPTSQVQVRDAADQVTTHKAKGVYVIVDGGYHRWKATMSASKLITDENFAAWRRRMESVRKDIEDVFGILKVA